MFEFVRKHNRLLQFLLALVIVPSFVLVGVQGYDSFRDAGGSVAEVAGRKISQTEWDNAHRREIDRLRSSAPQVDAAVFDRPEMKAQTLESLVQRYLLTHAANDLRLVTPDPRLQRLFRADPQLAFLRNPDGSVNKDALIAQGMTAAQLEAQLRQDLSTRQVLNGVSGTAFNAKAPADVALDALLQQREIQVLRVASKDFASKVQPGDADLQRYYDDPAHAAQFQSPEQADVQYVVLDAAAIKKTLSISKDELRKYFDENASRYVSAEERRASHILIKADASASADDKQKARAKAEALLAEVRKSPASFAELARKNSDDPGSASKGGDLDFFRRGAMVKPFEDTAFALKQGEISNVVESDFGFHIIQVTGVRGGEKQSFESLEAQLRTEVETQLVQRKYAELAEQFSNTVYEESDNLQPVADKLKLTIQEAKGMGRQPVPDAAGPLAHPKLLAALFSDDSIKNKRNTEAVEVAPQQMAAARIVKHTPAAKRPLAEVKDAVRAAVVADEAAVLARKTGESRLTEAKKSGLEGLPTALVVSRSNTAEQPREVVNAVLAADAKQLPAWIGVDLGREGYAVIRLNKVLPADAAAKEGLAAKYTQAWTQAEETAYYQALRDRYKVKVNNAATAKASTP